MSAAAAVRRAADRADELAHLQTARPIYFWMTNLSSLIRRPKNSLENSTSLSGVILFSEIVDLIVTYRE